jgi:putative endonuclease
MTVPAPSPDAGEPPALPARGDNVVYVLGSRSGARVLTYVGWSNDLARRLARHNAGQGARSTRGRQWVLLHVETFASREEAMSREWHLKRDRALRRRLAAGLSPCAPPSPR